MSDDRALSNTVGFVMLFAVVLASVTLTLTLGTGSLTQASDNTVLMNAGESMESMEEAIQDLREQNTTSRLSIIRAGRGTMEPGDNTTVEMWYGPSGGETQIVDRNIQPIVYRFQDTRIAYEAGALIQTQGGGGTMIDAPSFKVNGDVAIMPIIGTTSADDVGVSGGTVTTYLETTNSSMEPTGTDRLRIRIDTTEARAPVWQNYLSGLDPMNCDPLTSGGTTTVNCWTDDSGRTMIVRDITMSFQFAT